MGGCWTQCAGPGPRNRRGQGANGASGAVEEDARLTALFLWTLQSTDGAEDSAAGDEQDRVELTNGEDDDEAAEASGKAKGFTLVYDVVRRFAQPLGIDLPQWEGRIIETKQGVVRLLPVVDRSGQLFGEDGADTVAARLEEHASADGIPLQGVLFPDVDREPSVRSSRRASHSALGRRGHRWRRDRGVMRRHSTGCTPRSCCSVADARMPYEPCSRASKNAGPISSDSQTPSPRSIRRIPKRSDSSTRCSWRCRGRRRGCTLRPGHMAGIRRTGG